MKKQRNRKPLNNKKFGKLTVMRKTDTTKWKTSKGSLWLCKCDCGNEKLIWRKHLNEKSTCGCGWTYKPAPGFGQIYGNYKHTAKRRNWSFDIPQAKFYDLVTSNCFYCNIEPQGKSNTNFRSKKNVVFRYNGLDRVNTNLGYTLDNVVPCCKRCNIAKNDQTQEDFLIWVERLYKHQNRTFLATY